MVLVNRTNFKVEFSKVFDTYKCSDEFMETHIPDGMIVIAACKDECVTALSDEAK